MDLGAEAAVLLDASVLVECMVDGAHVDAATRLLDYLEANQEVEIVTAAHGLVEALSALRRLNLAGHLADAEAAEAATWLRHLDLRLDPTAPRIERLWSFRHTMTTYDASYAAAAFGLGLPLVSVDRPLLAACTAAGVPAVHLADATFAGL